MLAPAAIAGDDPAADNPTGAATQQHITPRRPHGDAELRSWLENMVWYHRYDPAEIAAATGLSPVEIEEALARLAISPAGRPPHSPGEPLLVLPYPGGRHPRRGFLDGAIDPQRETKFSVFLPWDAASYVVCDLPEAVWSNLGLAYLAHTHVPTLWSRAGIKLAQLEWRRGPGGSLELERRLPNDVAFSTRVLPTRQAVRMEMTLTNGTQETLSDLRVQMCAMLKKAVGFDAETNDNKQFRPPYAVCRAADAPRYIIWGWSPCHRAWGNPPCPCLHADPKFPDCPPGATVRARGWLSFYEGPDLDTELARITATGWEDRTPSATPDAAED